MRLLFSVLTLFSCLCPPADPPAPDQVRPQVAILIYHHIHDQPQPGTVTPDQFESHLQMLQQGGYHILHLEEYEAYLEGLLAIPDRSVLITFDDGYDSLYTRGLPLLQEYGAPATAFVVTKYFASEGRGAYSPHLTRGQARVLLESGLVSLQAHTHDGHHRVYSDAAQQATHPAMTAPAYLPDWGRMESREEYLDRIRADLRESRRQLELVGVPLSRSLHFALPFGTSSPDLVWVAREEGFRYLYTTEAGLVGPLTDRSAIPRLDAGQPHISAAAVQHQLQELFASRP